MRSVLIVALAGVVVATVDLVFAIAFWKIGYDTPPSRILQSVAAGVLGDASFRAGASSVALGAVCHYTIALGMAFVHYAVARRWTALVRHPNSLGLAYGALLYLVMNFVVLPVSRAGAPSFANTAWVGASIAVHLAFGIAFAHASRLAIARSA